MRSDLIRQFEAFNSNLSKVESLDIYLKSSIDSKRSKMEEFGYQAELHQKGSEIFKLWLEESLDKNVNSIADLVTSGLEYVIDDQKIKFSIEQEQKYNKISMKFVMSKDGHGGDPTESFGGGAVMVSSFILRLAIMARLNMANLLILDEPLNALAAKYIPNCGSFIRKLVEETGINILMVTHNEEFLNYAHTSYECSSTDSGNVNGHITHKLKISPFEAVKTVSS